MKEPGGVPHERGDGGELVLDFVNNKVLKMYFNFFKSCFV
jgi:hypothetical protein